MPSKQNAAAVTILLLLGAVGYGLVRTNGDAPSGATMHATTTAGDSSPTVDERPLSTAQRLVSLPTTPGEKPLAEDALRLGDKEMDLAFADAVRDLATRPQTTNPAVRAIATRLHAAQAELASDQAEVARIAAQAEQAGGDARATLTDRLNLGKAHLELVQDEVDDAREDLMRAGGDLQGQMQEMMDEHEALSRSSDSTRIKLVPGTETHGLIRHARDWFSLEGKRRQLVAARTAAESSAASFARRHDVVEASMHAADHDSVHSTLDHAASAALLLDTRRQAIAQKTRGTLDQHVDNEHHLAEVYGAWSDVVRGQQRHAVNGALRGAAVILCIVLAGLLLARWFERVLGTTAMDRRRVQTVYMVLRVVLQVIGVMLILLVVFGVPENLGTFLGLAGAGLTVALKDFLLGFFGWFVLMGRDGIGIGDLVEINGVTGEVQEIGMFHTVLLETGNWVDSGHHTGRRVTFSNSFAIEKHYFNFTTNGRWLWDEVRFVIPAGRDVPGIVGAIQARTEELTADSAGRAEVELRGARAPRGSGASAAPAIYIKPIVGGVEATVRYLTHVRERAQLRAQLYQSAIALLDDRPPAVAGGVLPTSLAAPAAV